MVHHAAWTASPEHSRWTQAIVRSMTWDQWPESAREVFRALRSEAGEEMVLEKNFFVERIPPESVIRDLSDEELETYRRPRRTEAPDSDMAS